MLHDPLRVLEPEYNLVWICRSHARTISRLTNVRYWILAENLSKLMLEKSTNRKLMRVEHQVHDREMKTLILYPPTTKVFPLSQIRMRSNPKHLFVRGSIFDCQPYSTASIVWRKLKLASMFWILTMIHFYMVKYPRLSKSVQLFGPAGWETFGTSYVLSNLTILHSAILEELMLLLWHWSQTPRYGDKPTVEILIYWCFNLMDTYSELFYDW